VPDSLGTGAVGGRRFGNVSSDCRAAIKDSLPNQDCGVAEVQPRECNDLSTRLDDDLNGGQRPPGHLRAAGVFHHGQQGEEAGIFPSNVQL
jgi:hypothetical protein